MCNNSGTWTSFKCTGVSWFQHRKDLLGALPMLDCNPSADPAGLVPIVKPRGGSACAVAARLEPCNRYHSHWTAKIKSSHYTVSMRLGGTSIYQLH